MYSLFLALHYVTKRPVMLLGMVGVLLGVWSLTVVPGIFGGYLREMHRHVRAASGDLTIFSLDRRLGFEEIEQQVLADPAVVAFAPRIMWYGALEPDRPLRDGSTEPIETAEDAMRDRPQFFQILGVDWVREQRVSDLGRWVQRVQDPERRALWPDRNPLLPQVVGEKTLPGLLLGHAAAEDERIVRGEALRLTSGAQHRHGAFLSIDETFFMTGTFSAGLYRYEKATAFVDIGTMRRVLYPGGVAHDSAFTEAAVRLVDGADPSVVLPRLRDRLNEQLRLVEGQLEIRTWQQKNAEYLRWIENQRSLFHLVLFVLIVVAVLLIFVMLLMMVTEKVRDIGILSALGGTRRGVAGLFLLCAFLVSATGAALGGVIGWLTCRNLDNLNTLVHSWLGLELFPKQIYGLDRVPYEFDPALVAVYGLVAIALSLLFALLPAVRAATLDPVRALRYD